MNVNLAVIYVKPGTLEFVDMVKAFVREFRCLKCGGCCDGSIGTSALSLDYQDLLAISRAGHIMPAIGEGFMPLPCVYLAKDKTCVVYQSRPKACRSFPWVADTVENGQHYPTLCLDCPGVQESLIKPEAIPLLTRRLEYAVSS